jgi:N-acylneuraminate cytidylyltransferase
MKAKNIIIIPARGGSKRFPGKNMALLDGIPLISHSINYAKANSEIIDEIVVSTDDSEIKEISLLAGVTVIDRPEKLSGDASSTVSALKHVLENMKANFNNVILLQPTNPLRPSSLLKDAYLQYVSGNYDSLMSVTKTRQKLGKIINNRFLPFNYEIGQRSQDLDPLYYENGLLYITKTSLIMEERILGENNLPFIIEHPFGNIDIDYKEDLDLAEFYFMQEKKRGGKK